jgi:hypothetical protein
MTLAGCSNGAGTNNQSNTSAVTSQPSAAAGQTATAQTGTPSQSGGLSPDNSSADSNAIQSGFDSLVLKEKDISVIRKYIDDNFTKASEATATHMALKLEELQKAYLPELDKKFQEEGMQAKLVEFFGSQLNKRPDEIPVSDAKDPGVKELLTGAINAGFRVETAEGMYYPMLDYRNYIGYVSRVSPDIGLYYNIMAIESSQVPAKDAAIIIGWDQIAARAFAQENFLSAHPDSQKAADIKQLYKKYVSFTFLGANNTPLFKYDTKMMDANAKEAYKKLTAEAGKSGSIKEGSYMDKLVKFMQQAEKEGYKLTDSMDKFRKGLLV